MSNFLEYVLLSPLRLIITALPFRTVQYVGKKFGAFVFRFLPIRKDLVMKNLRASFPEKNDIEIRSIALKNYENIFATFFETFWIPRMNEQNIAAVVSIPDHEIKKIDDIIGRGKGLIVLSGHITNWELAAMAVGFLTHHPLQIVIKKQHNPYFDRMMNSIRTTFNNTIVDMDKAPREVIKRLRNKEAVAMLADQSGPEEGLFVNFFGRPTSTHVGPAVFCLRTGCPIVMTYGVRTPDGNFDIWFEEVPTDDLTGSDDDKIRTITERHVVLLEKFVRQYPDQWLWMHKRWKHTESYLRRHAAEVRS